MTLYYDPAVVSAYYIFYVYSLRDNRNPGIMQAQYRAERLKQG